VALATPETTVTGRPDAFINMPASFIDQAGVSNIDIKLSQCIKIRLVSLHCKTVRSSGRRPSLAQAHRPRD
jgi:hypothetical protein